MAIKSFFKKLVYLYKTSVDTIQQFGLGYFLRFGSGQLRKQIVENNQAQIVGLYQQMSYTNKLIF
jgi:hypothetical protein